MASHLYCSSYLNILRPKSYSDNGEVILKNILYHFVSITVNKCKLTVYLTEPTGKNDKGCKMYTGITM